MDSYRREYRVTLWNTVLAPSLAPSLPPSAVALLSLSLEHSLKWAVHARAHVVLASREACWLPCVCVRCRHDYPHNPASLFAQWVDVALRIYAYSGNSSWVAKAEVMMAFQLANGTTSNSSEWTWPGVPYASSDAGYTVYRGSHHGNVSGSGDGVGVIEADKIGGVGLAWLALWKHFGSGETRREFMEAAVHGARVLAKNIRTSTNATVSPWPFRV